MTVQVLAHPLHTALPIVADAECVAAPPSRGNETGLFRGIKKKWTAWEHDEGHGNFTSGLDMIHLSCITVCVTNSTKGVPKWFAALNEFDFF